MKQRTRRNFLILLMALCVSLILSAFLWNANLSAPRASAAEGTTSSVEDSLTFNLFNNGTEYKVTARNKKITEAMIPAYYNDLPVTEISDNAFMSCTSLTEVAIPYTVKKIGNNAFANCTNLKKINGMSQVNTIGNNAFAMCAKLDKLILPYTIESLGSTILRNNPNTVYSRLSEAEMKTLNANWTLANETTTIIYGNELVLDEVYIGDEKIGYAIKIAQNMRGEFDFVLGDTYQGLPLLEIESCAFAFSEVNSFTLRHGEIITDVEEAAANNAFAQSIADDGCGHIVNIASSAFMSLVVNDITISVDVTFYDATFGDDGYSTSIFAGSTVRRVILPNNITVLPNSTFEGCEYLREISNTDPNVAVNYLSPNITTIGQQAFGGCTGLNFLHISSSVINMGNAVFTGWGDTDVKQILYLDDFYENPSEYEGYNWDNNWKGTTYDNVEIRYKTLKVVFDHEGGKEGIGTISVDAMYRQPMPEAEAPERDYYYFKGYYSERNGKGTKYYDENMNSAAPWDRLTDAVIYACWEPYTYKVTLDKNGGTGGTDEVIAAYEQPMPPAVKPERTGYRFLGYFYDIEDALTQYYDENMNSVRNWNRTEDATLTAKWKQIDYEVTLEQQGGTGGTGRVMVTYDSEMPPADAPVRMGWTFNGYFTEPNGEGEKYYNADMSGARNWDIPSDATLYAYWTETPYIIRYHKEGGEGGSDEETVYYKHELPAVSAPTREGYVFEGYYTKPNGQGRPYYDSAMTPVSVFDIDEDLDLYAYWTIPTIYLSKLSGTAIEVTLPLTDIVFDVRSTENYTITINSQATRVWIYGQGNEYNVNIKIQNRQTDFDLHLQNIRINAHSAQAAIAMQSTTSLNLYTYQSVEIKGCTQAYAVAPLYVRNGVTAISCSNLYIRSATNLYIRGGDGADGTISMPSGNGLSGGAAASGVTGNVYINCSNVTIAAGSAGNGGNALGSGTPGSGGAGSAAVKGTATILEGVTNVYLVASSKGATGKRI